MPTDHVSCEKRGSGVAVIRLDRPDKKNALTAAMFEALREGIEAADGSPDIRVMVIASTGDSFTAGADLQDFLAAPPLGAESAAVRFLRALAAAHKPLVAAVNGAAIGVGTTLLLHCDLVVASRTARFQLPFVSLGLVPEAASSLLLPRLVGHARAAELLLLGDPFDAPTALAYGIVNRVVPPAEVEPSALELAARLAAKAPAAVQHTKALLKSATTDVPARMAEEAALFARQLDSPEAREAIDAFFSRRSAQ